MARGRCPLPPVPRARHQRRQVLLSLNRHQRRLSPAPPQTPHPAQPTCPPPKARRHSMSLPMLHSTHSSPAPPQTRRWQQNINPPQHQLRHKTFLLNSRRRCQKSAFPQNLHPTQLIFPLPKARLHSIKPPMFQGLRPKSMWPPRPRRPKLPKPPRNKSSPSCRSWGW